jgi:hypothetical protein
MLLYCLVLTGAVVVAVVGEAVIVGFQVAEAQAAAAEQVEIFKHDFD